VPAAKPGAPGYREVKNETGVEEIAVGKEVEVCAKGYKGVCHPERIAKDLLLAAKQQILRFAQDDRGARRFPC